jgi:hypothetical protein
MAAWLCWSMALVAEDVAAPAIVPAIRYLALALTASAEVAVLGARRPGVVAWNFVVAGFLTVVLSGGDRSVLLVGALLVGCLNYLPTKFALAAVLLAVAAGLEVYGILAGNDRFRPAVDALLAVVPWTAWLLSRRSAPALDRAWLDFRDRFGFVWGQRLRDQFNRAAHHAGWPVELGWSGWRAPTDAVTQTACLATLQALMKRFGPPEEDQ